MKNQKNKNLRGGLLPLLVKFERIYDMLKIKDFLISKKHTIAAISWTKPKELIRNWFTVIIFTTFFTAALFGVDMLISYILKIFVNM